MQLCVTLNFSETGFVICIEAEHLFTGARNFN